MLYLELILRVSGVTLLLMQTALLIRHARKIRAAQFGIALSLSLACVMATDTVEGAMLPKTALLLLTPISMSSAIFVWWFSQSLFEDDFRVGLWQLAVAAIWIALGIFNFADVVDKQAVSYPLAAAGREMMAVGFVAHIVYLALAERKNDLVERRRKVRTYFALTIMAVFLIDLLSERVFGFEAVPIWSSALQNASYLAVIIWSVFWLNRIDTHELVFEEPVFVKRTQTAEDLSPRELALKEKLDDIMDTDKAWLDQDLSIASLAEKVGAPEHQLRQLINKSMGHRNFRSFLNEYRLAAAKAALADKALATTPVLTIAMDSGFASLSSFNRAFKQETSMTPTAYREGRLGNEKGAASPQNASQN